MTTNKTEVKANEASNVIAVGKALAVFDSSSEKLEAARQNLIDNAQTVLAGCKTGEEWESAVKGFALGYKAERKCNDDAAAKAAQRIVLAVRSTFDTKKPQSAEAVQKENTRKAAKLIALEAALASGIGAEEALKTVEKMKKSDSAADKKAAAELLQKTQAQRAAREALKQQEAKQAEYSKALALLANHYHITVEVAEAALKTASGKKAKAA